ncbi:uncharacterized protein LOC122849126 [Aphidius gifuensis]|uniref:uncharacterized protein LOC122849126 n=1 Tax=Aphidius gifuensis TaxID=684658 RepID=UPI001CDB99B8|nr:uncharacterized protein LOC122849126 [Aphidius gifuensis]
MAMNRPGSLSFEAFDRQRQRESETRARRHQKIVDRHAEARAQVYLLEEQALEEGLELPALPAFEASDINMVRDDFEVNDGQAARQEDDPLAAPNDQPQNHQENAEEVDELMDAFGGGVAEGLGGGAVRSVRGGIGAGSRGGGPSRAAAGSGLRRVTAGAGLNRAVTGAQGRRARDERDQDPVDASVRDRVRFWRRQFFQMMANRPHQYREQRGRGGNRSRRGRGIRSGGGGIQVYFQG